METSGKPPRSRARSAPKRRSSETSLDRAAWVAAARGDLIAGGIGSVKVGKLAKQLEVTRESFYWHFKNLAELHDELLADWERDNVAAYESLLNAQRDAEEEFQAMEKMWIGEEQFSPAWDSAMRDWSRVSKKAARVVSRIDERRIEVIYRMYIDMGYEHIEALVRARITYFHQVGYYTVNIKETREERLRLFPEYIRVLRIRKRPVGEGGAG